MHEIISNNSGFGQYFDLEFIDPGKLCTIISTHLTSIDTDKNDTSTMIDYSSFLQKIKCLKQSCHAHLDSTQVNFKFCEIFTAAALFQTKTFNDAKYNEFYSPIIDIFTASNTILPLDIYFRLCHDMNWDFIAAHFICSHAKSDFVKLILNQLYSPSLSMFLLMKRCLYFYNKSASVNKERSTEINSPNILISNDNDKRRLNLQETVNEIFYHLDIIITNLYKCTYSNENSVENFVRTISANKSTYCDLASKAKYLIKQCQESTTHSAEVCDLQDSFILFTCLFRYVNGRYKCDLPELFDSNVCIHNIEKYSFMKNLMCIYRLKQSSIFAQNENGSRFYVFVCKLLFSFAIDRIEYYIDCPLFASLPLKGQESSQLDLNEIDSIVGQDLFWLNLMEAYSFSVEKDEFFNIFFVITKLFKLSKINSVSDEKTINRLQQILVFAFTSMLRNRLQDIAFIDGFFAKRTSFYGIDKLQFGSFKLETNLIKENAFSKIKIDWQNDKIRLLALEIIFNAFISPLDTYDSLLNSALIFSPLYYNHLIVHLLCNHLRSLSQTESFVCDNESGQNLNLIEAISIIKFRQSYDIISIESFSDYLQLVCKSNITDFETIFSNLLAYNKAQSQNWPLHFLQSILDMNKNVYFKSCNIHKYTIITAFLLSVLAHHWLDQTKKEVIIATIRTYIAKNEVKLSEAQVDTIALMIQKSIGTPIPNLNVEYLLFYLENSFAFSTQKRLQMDPYSVIFYAAISSKSEWLVDVLADHSNYLFDQLFFVFCDILAFLTQKELNNLIEFLSKTYSKLHLYLIMLLVLSVKLENSRGLNPESFIYFARSVFILLDQLPSELKTTVSKIGNEIHSFNQLLYIYFKLLSIESNFNSNKNSSQFGTEICLEVKKTVQSVESIVQLYSRNINSYDAKYIDTIRSKFWDEMHKCNLLM